MGDAGDNWKKGRMPDSQTTTKPPLEEKGSVVRRPGRDAHTQRV